jgi:predicted metal-dependent peptidase
MATDGAHIFYNPQWVFALTDTQIQAVMAHELMHVVMNHNTRQKSRDALRWNMACDFCINGLLHTLGFDLPKGGLLEQRFYNQTSEEIYEALERDWDIYQKKPDAIGSDLVDGNDPRVGAQIPDDALDEESARALRTALQETVRQALRGTDADVGGFEREFEQSKPSRVDWRAVLQNLLQSALMCDWASIPFAKKHLHRGLYLPSVAKPAAMRVVFAIDTSGSVSDQQINDIMNELLCFASLHEGPLSIVQCDSEIRHVLHINETPNERNSLTQLQISGRGGTAFIPVFEWIKTNTDTLGEIALLVYATDGLGSFPKQTPTFPVLWLLSDESTQLEDLPFGTGVSIC